MNDKAPGVTELLDAVSGGDRSSYDRLLAAVHQELRKMAAGQMRGERQGHTLQPTALVNEAYIRLVGSSSWENRSHFFGAAARCMRQILVDHARKQEAAKRGGGLDRVTLEEERLPEAVDDRELLSLDEALTELRAENERLAQVVEMRFFAGMTGEEIASALDVGSATVKRDWRYAKAWLGERMQQQ